MADLHHLIAAQTIAPSCIDTVWGVIAQFKILKERSPQPALNREPDRAASGTIEVEIV
ncbi:MAG: hypothetical protein F6K32_20145 [Desertifilum sp. SIO1I2]|nr:hypothetical protein [Desertifilum sp. SIO1I2]